MTKESVTPKQLRSFGLIVGIIFALVGLWPVAADNRDLRWWALAVAATFIVAALLAPSSLASVHRAWMFIGHVLGLINTRIILALGFYGILMPIGLSMRLMGKDPMRRKKISEMKTYRVERASRPGSHMRQQF